MARRPMRRPVDSRRNPPKREPRTLFIVVTEGEVTEVEYLKFIGSSLSPLIRIKPVSPNLDPMGLAKTAIRAKTDAERINSVGKDDEFWCVLDVDDYSSIIPQAEALAAKSGISVVVSNPSFEIWLLCHFEFSSAPRTASQAVRQVGRHIPGYSEKFKHLPAGVLDERYTAAKAAAERLQTHHSAAGNSTGSNPSTNMWLLVDALSAAHHRSVAGKL